jgi:hypothetical protein
MKNVTCTLKEAQTLCKTRKATGYWFGVTTNKVRTNGKLRRFICRGGVKQGVTGAGLKFDPAKKDLLGIWDVPAHGHRFIDLLSIKEVRITGTRYIVV